MTREEQIYNQSIPYTRNIFGEIEDFSDVVDAFADGARWADENPQFLKEEFIEKACEWLELHINDDKYYSCIGEETLIPYLIEDFKQAMEE